MKHKGYHGQVRYDEEAKLFHGEVVGLRDVITFQGTSVDELEQAFKDSVDEYLDFCKELGRAPEKHNSIFIHDRKSVRLNLFLKKG